MLVMAFEIMKIMTNMYEALAIVRHCAEYFTYAYSRPYNSLMKLLSYNFLL